jgi:probable O-glycosylation ligase (exosortase A-associated)
MWSWLGYMNPHRYAWGFAYGFPFSQLVALSTIAGLFLYKDRSRVPLNGVTIVLTAFAVWMTLSTFFSIYPEDAWEEWDRTMKILLFTFLTIVLMQKEDMTRALIWVVALSFAFFGFKGGLFSVLTAGNYRVFGPPDTFIEDNNALALAVMMVIPLMRFCHLRTTNRWGRLAWLATMGLSTLAILTSHSRGALVGSIVTLMFVWWKSKRKIVGVLLVLPLIPFLISFMPEHWFERMQTISTYEEDASAMGRINAWWFAYYLALDRPLVGGGYQVFSPELFRRYAPVPDQFHDSHSIYFEVLAEHGFVGFGLFLALLILVFRMAGKLAKARVSEEMDWLPQLAGLVQVGLVSYAVTGLFLGLAYFDLYYQYVAIVVILKVLIDKHRILAGGQARAVSY